MTNNIFFKHISTENYIVESIDAINELHWTLLSECLNKDYHLFKEISTKIGKFSIPIFA